MLKLPSSFSFVALTASAMMFSGCSTIQAVDKTGEKLENVVNCETSACLKILRTAEVLEKDVLNNGDTSYLIRIQRQQGSYLRALGYGVAAVYTLGLSEVLATPLEGALQNENQMGVEAVCGKDDYCHRLVVSQLGQPVLYVRGITAEEQAKVDAHQQAASKKN